MRSAYLYLNLKYLVHHRKVKVKEKVRTVSTPVFATITRSTLTRCMISAWEGSVVDRTVLTNACRYGTREHVRVAGGEDSSTVDTSTSTARRGGVPSSSPEAALIEKGARMPPQKTRIPMSSRCPSHQLTQAATSW